MPAAVQIAVVGESAPGERRVALVPDGVARLTRAGLGVLAEGGAGASAGFADGAYAEAGATIASRADALARADVIACVARPGEDVLAGLRHGQALVGLLQSGYDAELVARCAAAGASALSFDRLPRTLSRAQAMDALTSQATVAGYKAVVLAAATYERFFPMLITAAGTARPARVLVLGAGVAGLQAIGTARRLGAATTAYDVRPQAKEEVESLGASYLELRSVADGGGAGGYARALTDDEQRALTEEIATHVPRYDVVLTTAQVPGRRPPLLVTTEAVKSMRAGSVVVDIAASPFGGNVEPVRAGETLVTDNGVTVIGADNLPATMPEAASTAYSRNITALLLHVIRDGQLAIDLDDEIQAGVVLTHEGEVLRR